MEEEEKKLYGTVTLFRAASWQEVENMIVSNKYNGITWWTSNKKDLGHYFEQAAIEIIIKIDEKLECEYIAEKEVNLENYTFGQAEMKCPEGSIWFSIGGEYLKDNIVSLRKVDCCEIDFTDDEDDVD